MRAGVKVQIWQAPTLAADSGSLELLCCLHQDRRQARPNSQLEARDWGGPTTSSMRPKKSYCWLTVWSCSFIGLSGPRQTSRQKHRLKTRNWANPSDDWSCGISQIKTEQERNLHKLDVDCVRLNKYRLEGGSQEKRDKEMKTEREEKNATDKYPKQEKADDKQNNE